MMILVDNKFKFKIFFFNFDFLFFSFFFNAHFYHFYRTDAKVSRYLLKFFLIENQIQVNNTSSRRTWELSLLANTLFKKMYLLFFLIIFFWNLLHTGVFPSCLRHNERQTNEIEIKTTPLTAVVLFVVVVVVVELKKLIWKQKKSLRYAARALPKQQQQQSKLTNRRRRRCCDARRE